jgi:hypothetical protein
LRPDIFAHGFRVASIVAGSMCLVGAVLGAVAISNRTDSAADSDSPSPPLSQTCVGATAPPLTADCTTE